MALVLVAACSGGGSEAPDVNTAGTTGAPVVVTTSTTTSTSTTSTTVAPTTTAATTTTVAPYHGLRFPEGQMPTFAADGVTARINLITYFDTTAPEAELVDECRFEIEFERAATTQCLYVQWEFDVAADFPVDEYSPDGGLSSDDYIGPDGIAHSSAFAASGYPGTVKNHLGIVYAVTAPGGSVRFQTGSNLVGWTVHEFPIPDTMPPVTLNS